MMKSTNADIFSVGLPLPDTIGLPGVGVVFLWIFGRRQSSGVLALVVLSASITSPEIAPNLNRLSMKSLMVLL